MIESVAAAEIGAVESPLASMSTTLEIPTDKELNSSLCKPLCSKTEGMKESASDADICEEQSPLSLLSSSSEIPSDKELNSSLCKPVCSKTEGMKESASDADICEEKSPLALLSSSSEMPTDEELNSSLCKPLCSEIDIPNEPSDQIQENSNSKEVSDSDAQKENVRKIKTINDGLAGQNHPDTGVPYVEKTVETDTGEKVKGVFPQFDSIVDVQLPENLQQATDRAQFGECNRQLKERIATDPELKSKFTEDQLADIEDGYTPEGYTWHHNEEKGKMQLVESDVHEQTRHTGGRNIWGGGTENRR